MGMRMSLREVQPGDLQRLNDPDQADDLFIGDEDGSISLEKSWDGLHHLMTAAGSAPELGFLHEGGTEVGEDLGYGPPRVLNADYVRKLNAALQGISDEQLWAGYNAERFEADDVYPGIWDEEEDDLREEYVEYFHELKNFVARVAAAGREIVVALL